MLEILRVKEEQEEIEEERGEEQGGLDGRV
jgi:hypothetical protein